MEDSKELREDFCPACVAVPLALAGVGISAGGGIVSKGSYKKMRNYMLWGGLSLTLVSTAIAIYVLFVKKCNSCR